MGGQYIPHKKTPAVLMDGGGFGYRYTITALPISVAGAVFVTSRGQLPFFPQIRHKPLCHLWHPGLKMR
jgi:hypothetical protein